MALDVDLLAEALPRYEIGPEIGRGGWGIVYSGRHRDLGRAVAIKQLPRAFGADPSVRDRFIAEARLVASLEHPHIVPVYDFVERDGLYVIVMELATGGTLWKRFTDKGLQTDEAVAAVLATAVGLHYAHTRSLLHRDVKPDNILYTSSGTAKIADFGIAKAMGETQERKTATGLVIGTPAYMAPEQVTGGELSPATDIYALAIVLYQLVSGHLPYPDVTDAVGQLFQHVHDEPRPLATTSPEVPAPLADAIHRALAKAPADRPASAEAFAIELATAATASFGPGWLARSGVHVMGSTGVIAATERTTVALDDMARTVLVRPDNARRLRLGGLQSAAPSERVGPPTSAQPEAIEPTTPLHRASDVSGAGAAAPAPATARAPERAASPSLPTRAQPPTEHGDAPRSARLATGLRRRMTAGLLAAPVIGVAAIVAAVFLFNGGGGQDPAEPAGTEAAIAAISASEAEAFRGTCEDNGVDDGLCSCALDRGIEDLDPATFRSGLATMLESDGVLTDEFATIFQSCLDDGF